MEIYNKFNHIKVHSQYSICEGALKIDELSEFCKKNKIKALGLSDSFNLCGALEFSENISKSGTQPILGTQVNFKFNEILNISAKVCKIPEMQLHNCVDFEKSCKMRLFSLS